MKVFVTEVCVGRLEFQICFVSQFGLASGRFSSTLLRGFWPYVKHSNLTGLWSGLMTEWRRSQERGT